MEFAQHRRLLALGNLLLCRFQQSLVRHVGLKASLPAAATLASTDLNTGMSHLTGKAVDSQVRLAVGEDATAQAAMTDTDNDKILHAMCGTEGFFSQSRDVGIVGQSYRQSQLVAEHGCQGHHALPLQVGSILDAPRLEIGTRSTDAYGTDGLIAAVLFSKRKQFLTECCHIVTHLGIVRRAEIILGNDFTPDVHKRIRRSGLADVNTDDTRFDLVYCFCHCTLIYKQ